MARARDVIHWNKLRDLGVTLVQRELFESSLQSAHTVLELMGLPPEEATAFTQRFRKHNIALADRMYPHYKDQAKYIAVAREGRSQLAEQMAKERQEASAHATHPVHYPGYLPVDGTAATTELPTPENMDQKSSTSL